MEAAAEASDSKTSLERKRLFIYRAFLVLAIINNSFLAVYCLALGGGSFFAEAPAWSVTALGLLGSVTALFSVAGLLWKKWGIYAMTIAGVSAAVVAALAQLYPAAVTFVVGTAFLLLIARHQWRRLTW
jgi:hypothetical protein